MNAYPASTAERDAWVVSLRGARVRPSLSPDEPYAFLLEQERFASGGIGPVATIFLTNRECPWRCAMCDLWRHTLPGSVEVGQIPRQMEYALKRLGPARQVKLYNSGSFFDPHAIPVSDHAAIAELAQGFERVIVECHPALAARCAAFARMLPGTLEVAMGLETVHREALAKLNKRMTLEGFARSAARLLARGMEVRAFVVVGGPFQPAEEAVEWACRSVEFARQCGAGVVSLILARGGNGTMEALARAGQWRTPSLRDLEDAVEFGLRLGSLRVFADTWGLAAACESCGPARVARLGAMNLSQEVQTRVECAACA